MRAYVPAGRTAALLGSSGVGKSTLVNALARRRACWRRRTSARTAAAATRRRTAQLVPLPDGGLVLDTPGMRELQLWDADDGLDAAFEESRSSPRAAASRDCAHDREPGCAIRAALADGTLDAERYESWRKLQRELERLERKQDAPRPLRGEKGAGALREIAAEDRPTERRRPGDARADADDAGDALDEPRQQLGRLGVRHLALDRHLACVDVDVEPLGRVPERPQDHVLADLALDRLVVAHERAHEVGAASRCRRASPCLSTTGSRLTRAVEHQRRGLGDRPIRTDRHGREPSSRRRLARVVLRPRCR